MTEVGTRHIIPLEPRHVPGLHALIRVCYDAYGMVFSLEDPAEAHLVAPIEMFGGNLWCIEAGGERSDVLFASAGLSMADDGLSAEMKTVYVHPEARRRGLGRAMTEHAIVRARTLGVQRIHLWSDTRFTAAHAMYRSMGFVPTGERACEDFNNSREYGFELAVVPADR